MNDLKQILKKLENFGLSENQAAIYLILSQKKELRIQEISNLTSIPRSSVYENLKFLFKIGLAEKVIDEKFTRIKSYPISALKHGLNEKIIDTQELIKELGHIENSLNSLPDSKASDSTIVRYYKGVSGARQLFWNSLNAKSVVYVYSEFGRSKFVGKKFYIDFVRQSKERNIKEKVLVNPTIKAMKLIEKDSGSSLARTKINDIRFLKKEKLTIRGETFIYDNVYAQINLNTAEINGFEIESSNFTNPQKSIFEILWKSAKPIFLLKQQSYPIQG